jgi:hypothetical protein
LPSCLLSGANCNYGRSDWQKQVSENSRISVPAGSPKLYVDKVLPAAAGFRIVLRPGFVAGLAVL